MSKMYNFDQVILGKHAVEDLEPKLPDNLAANAMNSRQLCRFRMPPNEFHRRIHCGHDAGGSAGTACTQVFMNGNQIARGAPTKANPHRTPQRFQNDRIDSSLTDRP